MRERKLRHELVTLDAKATHAAAEMASRKEEMLASTLGTLQGLGQRGPAGPHRSFKSASAHFAKHSNMLVRRQQHCQAAEAEGSRDHAGWPLSSAAGCNP